MPNRYTAAATLLLASAATLVAQTAPIPEIALGETVRGTITADDPTLDDDSHFDLWHFRGRPGDVVEIVMESDDFDAILLVAQGPEGLDAPVETDDDGAGGTDARIAFTLEGEEYWIAANTLEAGSTGSYTLRLASLASLAERGPAVRAGDVVEGVLAATDPTTFDGSHYDDYSYEARRGERLTVSLDSPDFDAYLGIGRESGGAVEILDSDDDGGGDTNARLTYIFPEAGTFVIRANSLNEGETGSYTLRLDAAGEATMVPAPPATPIRAGDRVQGALTAESPRTDDGAPFDGYRYDAVAGHRALIDLASTEFDTHLTLGRVVDGVFEPLATNDDNDDGGTDSTLVYTFPATGEYVLRAGAFSDATGAYTLAVRSLD